MGIWLSRSDGRSWSAPEEVADGGPHPCWNPVLFQLPDGLLSLYYKVGPSPREWWGLVMTSEDGGASWSEPRRLPDGVLGPIKNKPLLLGDGALLCGSSTEHDGWRVHFERTPDGGRSWSSGGPLDDPAGLQAIQPTLLRHADGRLQALCRSRGGVIAETWSVDGGQAWSALAPTALPNSSTGIDGLTLDDGRQLLVYNHARRGRTPLNVALSRDGATWLAALVLEDGPGEYSYPAVIQAADGRVHVTYTWKRRGIKYAVIDPEALVPRAMPEGRWPGE